MAWPTTTISTANLDSGTDSPGAARTDLLAMAQAVNQIINEGLPPGVVMPFAGTAAPGGWLLAYGQAVSRTTYAGLFTAIGTTFGTGDGSTTFNLPDLRGRVAAGKDDMGGTAASRLTSGGSGVVGTTLGATGGAETHTLTIAQMPAHTHPSPQSMPAITNAAGSINRASSNTADKAAAVTDSTGGGGAHNNVQPTLVLNHIIKT